MLFKSTLIQLSLLLSALARPIFLEDSNLVSNPLLRASPIKEEKATIKAITIPYGSNNNNRYNNDGTHYGDNNNGNNGGNNGGGNNGGNNGNGNGKPGRKPCRSRKGLLGLDVDANVLRLVKADVDLDILNGCSLLDLDVEADIFKGKHGQSVVDVDVNANVLSHRHGSHIADIDADIDILQRK